MREREIYVCTYRERVSERVSERDEKRDLMIGRAPSTLIMLTSPVDTLLMKDLKIKRYKSIRKEEKESVDKVMGEIDTFILQLLRRIRRVS